MHARAAALPCAAARSRLGLRQPLDHREERRELGAAEALLGGYMVVTWWLHGGYTGGYTP